MSDFIFILYGLLGSVFFGLTAVILKNGVFGQEIYYGILIRVLGALPLLLIFSYTFIGPEFYKPFLDLTNLGLTSLSAVMLILGDLLLMNILKTKSVGTIIPIVAVNPIFTLILLKLTGEVDISAKAIIWTIVIILGIMLVTYEKSESTLFDLESISYGVAIAIVWGIMLFLEIITLDNDGITGTSYATMKISIFGIIGVLVLLLRSFQGNSIKKIIQAQSRRSFKFLLLSGFVGWCLGTLFVYSAFDGGPASIITAIVGMNPLFAILASIAIRQEDLNLRKLIGMLTCLIGSLFLVL